MRFGLHYLNTYVPEADGPVPQLYGHLTQQIQEAEALGFDDAWVTEHHFHEFGGQISQPPVFLAAVYGGYFGAGLSVILLAVLGLVLPDSLTRLNALKQAVSFCTNTPVNITIGITSAAMPTADAALNFPRLNCGKMRVRAIAAPAI